MELSFGRYSIGVKDIKEPFRVNIKPPFLGVVIDFLRHHKHTIDLERKVIVWLSE